MNTFVAFVLMLILYLIFCGCTRPEDLLINCIAINFLADADNRLITEGDVARAITHLRAFNLEWQRACGSSEVMGKLARSSTWKPPSLAKSDEAQSGSASEAELGSDEIPINPTPTLQTKKNPVGALLQIGMLHANILIRLLLPFVACILTLFIAFGNNDVLCLRMRAVEPWPFCARAGRATM